MRRLLGSPARGIARLDAADRTPQRSIAAPSAESTLLAIGWLFVGTATFALAVSLVPHTDHLDGWPRWTILSASYALGIALILGRRRLPEEAVDFGLAGGIALITVVLMLRGSDAAAEFPVFYVWSALAAAFLLSRNRALLQIAFIAVADAVYLRDARVAPHVAVHSWLLTIGTIVLGAGVVSALRARVERLVDDLAETSKRDPRSGLLNGSGLEDLIERELERAHRNGGTLSLVVCDLDRFKDVNEELGHRAADAQLLAVADVLDRTKRRIDVVARLSGQVFGLLLPDTDEHGAYVLADRLRRAVRESFAGAGSPLTASLGVASFPKHGGTYEELYGAATRAVYVAKELGRDRSVIYNPEISANLRSAAARDGMQAEEHLAAVLVLAETLDMRDTSTARHSETVARYAKLIATELGLPEREVERVHLAGMLHDIGKIGISDKILQKPGSLNQPEWDEMRKHPELGSRILDGARLEDISAWVRAHHERPDGRGYPLGLCDEQIPIQAKILAVADSYEAMTAERVYKTAMTHEEARVELVRCSGSQFDPRVVHAFATAMARVEREQTAEAVA